MKKPNWNIPSEDELIADFEPDADDILGPQNTSEKIASSFNPYNPDSAKKMFYSGLILSIIAIIFMLFSLSYTLHLKKYYSNSMQNQSLNLRPSYGTNFESMDRSVSDEENQTVQNPTNGQVQNQNNSNIQVQQNYNQDQQMQNNQMGQNMQNNQVEQNQMEQQYPQNIPNQNYPQEQQNY